MTPIPAQVKDPKDAVLWAVLHSLEQIDCNTSSRALYAQSVLFNISMNLDGPCFKEEVRQLKEVLGVPEEAPACPIPEVLEARQVSESGITREDAMFRDL